MKIAALMVAAAALLPLSATADGPVTVSDFPLADRIKEKVASGKPLDKIGRASCRERVWR